MTSEKIPGIYNYCDRWCERCAFGSRCAVYESESQASPEENDMKNRAFWNRLAENFANVRRLLEDAAREQRLDFKALVEGADVLITKNNTDRDQAKEHPLAKLSFSYIGLSRDWLSTQPGMIQKLEQLRDNLTLGVESVGDAKAKTNLIKECLEVIQWYQTFIHAKFMRALMSRAMAGEAHEDRYDSDGSAKIAMLSIERSMQAWVKLFDLLPEQEDHFLKILALLEKIRKLSGEAFPNAMRFRRPGFDDDMSPEQS